MRTTLTLAGLLFCTLATAGIQSSDKDVVATIGKEKITAAQVLSGNRKDFDAQKAAQEIKARQLEAQTTQERYNLMRNSLEKMLDQRALEMEAEAAHVSTATVLSTIRVPAVTDEEARAFYDTNRNSNAPPWDQAQPIVMQVVAAQHNAKATRKFYDDLRAKYGIKSTLPPYRVQVAASGPARGKAEAPVTIVEFADFQCPFCQKAEATLRTVIADHGDSVRLVFRNLPLSDIHPNATVAAVAGVCADKQGKFWDMHDAMFSDQASLNEDGLKATARRLGLDSAGFSACMADPQTKASLEADTHAADELNIKGTPYFFINGRPLYGSLPAEEFESIIADELSRAADKRG
jgi:protein-disulfide isomerase